MTNKEIVIAALEKAYMDIKIDPNTDFPATYFWIIFSHPFAKRFFGEERVDSYGRVIPLVPEINRDDFHYAYTHKPSNSTISKIMYEKFRLAWQYHLQQMVLKEQPPKYLEMFLN